MAQQIKLSRSFVKTRLERATLEAILTEARATLGAAGEDPDSQLLKVQRGADQWTLPDERQFLAEIGNGYSSYHAWIKWGSKGSLDLFYASDFTIEIMAPERTAVESVAQMIAQKLGEGVVEWAPEVPLRVFIGHGRSGAWNELKQHLIDIHHIEVEAYEVAARGGYTIREVLDSMLRSSTLAFLVMTAEDAQADDTMRARQNVVHEVGLFQGRLGFSRAVILKEAGVELFSNVDGVQYIEFSAGNIRECFGDVLGVINREFPALRRSRPLT
ncbi:hypothetical protein Lsed01_02282 [Demequina sediminis]|uniref:CD-NTase-associated protein 12/Pycsar effector protein TIR domain-containing protein n=1 Tax=Demequina sediminis TaxID=1930058 RepID=A0ABP9WJP9_9MICO|nr:nucleotide-binding protein [Demequina sediminis]BDZ60591.1 hypothetical protein GCM10025873_03820 [Demequina sediminis]